MVVGLRLFLTRTTAGKAALAVGQNPRGAAIVGIDVDRTYGLVFALASALVGMMGAVFITRSSIFPAVGSPFTMKSFCLIAMAGIGNIPGILGAEHPAGHFGKLPQGLPRNPRTGPTSYSSS